MVPFWTTLLKLIVLLNFVSASILQEILKLKQEAQTTVDDPFKRPNETYHDMEKACEITKTMINKQSIALINTNQLVFKENEGEEEEEGEEYFAMSFPEYSIDCYNSSNPVLLMIKMSKNFKNIVNLDGLKSSITYVADLDEYWPGSVPGSMYGSPRVNLRGYFREIRLIGDDDDQNDISLPNVRYVDIAEIKKLEYCFKSLHPESTAWFPGPENKVHSSIWTEFVVQDGYFVGGFGGYAYIGGLECW